MASGPFALLRMKIFFIYDLLLILSEQVSKAARDAKKFVDYNQRCASYHHSKVVHLLQCRLITSDIGCCACVNDKHVSSFWPSLYSSFRTSSAFWSRELVNLFP